MDVRAKQRLCLLACLFNSNELGGGFAPRHLSRSVSRVSSYVKIMKVLIRIILLFIFLTLFISIACACDCDTGTPSEKLRTAKVVFVGKVVAIGNNDKDNWATVAIKFKVERYWKGVKEKYITIVSAPGICCTCGLPVTLNAKWLIYASETEVGQLATSICGSISFEYATEDLREIGKGKKLKRKT